MKTRKILKIIAVVFAVLFGLTVAGGIVYTAVSDYSKQSNDSCAVVECTDNALPFTGTQCNYQELGSVKSTAVAFADTPTTVTPTKGTCRYTVYAPEEAFPITLYGYNGTSKKSTVVNNNGDTISLVTYWYMDSVTNQIRVVAQGSITYFYAVDCNGLMLFIDYHHTDDCTAFPINAAGCSDTNNILSSIGFGYELDEIMSNAFTSGFNQGHTAGYDEGHSAGVEEGHTAGYNEGNTAGYNIGHTAGYNEGRTAGYDEGHTAGYNEGNTAGYNRGHVAGYDEGHTAGFDEGKLLGHSEGFTTGYNQGKGQGYSEGYNIGYNDGENKTLSVQLTNPISSFLQPVHEFMNTKFFGDLTYGSIFNVVLFVAVALIFIKMFSGG